MIIKLDNIEDGEVFPNPVILLSGTVTIAKEGQSLIYVFQNVRDMPQNAYKSVLQNGKFKILVHLALGTNDLSFRYKNSTRSTSVIFAPLQKQPVIRLLYIVCQDSDGCFQSPPEQKSDVDSACKRISLASKLIQCFFSESLKQLGFPRKTLSFGACSVFRSELTVEKAWSMTGEELWSAHAKEILERYVGDDETKHLAILSATRYVNPDGRSPKDFADVLSLTKGHAAFGGGDLALFGSGCLYTWPESLEEVQERLSCQSPVDSRLYMDDSAYRGTMGGCFATTLGAIIHELGHSLDLSHFREGIMARGFDSMDYFFCANVPCADSNLLLPSCMERKPLNLITDCESTITEKSGAKLLEEYQSRQRLLKIKAIFGTAYWDRSSALILNHHRWLNSYAASDSSIWRVNGLLQSNSSIVVVELRDGGNNSIGHLEPGGNLVQLTSVKHEYPKSCTLFAMNREGAMIKIEHF